MDRHTIKGILAKYSPPLSPGQMDEIAEAIMYEWSLSFTVPEEPKAETSKRSRPKRKTSHSPRKVETR
jgi:hypothetical protein